MNAARWRALAACAAAWLAACTPAADESWSGYIEGEYVHVGAPLAGRLTSLDAVRGGQVARGATLFRLDTDIERAAREEAADRAAAAQAQAADAAKGQRSDELAVRRAQLAQAQAQAGLAARELARQQQLIERGFVSPARLDDARAEARHAQARLSEQQASLRVAQLPARSDALDAAAASASAAARAFEQARTRERQKQQHAPVDARVADTYYRVGEWVGAGQPVVALLPAGAVKARFFVPQGELGAIALGQPVAVRCDGCGAPIRASIDFIATRAEYTPPVIYSNTQRARLVFMVEARPIEPRDAARLHPGQPVDVRRAADGAAVRATHPTVTGTP